MKNPIPLRELHVGASPSVLLRFVQEQLFGGDPSYRVQSWGPNTDKYVITDLIWGGQYAVQTHVEELPCEERTLRYETTIEQLASKGFPARVPPKESDVVARMRITYVQRTVTCAGEAPDIGVGNCEGRTVTELGVGYVSTSGLLTDILDFLHPAGRL